MTLRPHRNLVVWSQSVGPTERYGVLRLTRLTRTGRIRRCIRTGALLIVVAMMRLASTVRTRQQAHKQRCELERELAEYSTPAQRCDLQATLNRYPDSVTYELRDILTRQAIAAFNNRLPVAGRY